MNEYYKLGFVKLLLLLSLNVWGQCNGSIDLCTKSYDEVSFLTTHNAYNSEEEGFIFPNQNYGITKQLNDGVRALMLDVYDLGGVLMVYHVFDALGTKPFVDVLTEVKYFLDENPNEIVTVILENYVDCGLIGADLQQAELTQYLYYYDANESWKTLQQMIDDNQRLVVFVENGDDLPNVEWCNYVWDFSVETHYANHSISDLNCDFNRGNPENDLFIFNHFVTSEIGVGEPDTAAIINQSLFLTDRIEECQSETQKFPNFLVLDFYDLGNGLDVINQLNGIEPTSVELPNAIVKIYPNPTDDYLYIESLHHDLKNLKIFNYLGANVTNLVTIEHINPYKIRMDVSGLQSGVYMINVDNESNRFMVG